MNLKIRKRIKFFRKVLALLLLVFIVTNCQYFDELIHPASVKVNETFDVTMVTRFQTNNDYSYTNVRYVVAVLAPRSWNVRENYEITYTSPQRGSGTMSVIPNNVLVDDGKQWPRALRDTYGIGPNLVDDLEWVAFYTDRAYNISPNENVNVTVNLKLKAGSENTRVKLGYFVGNTENGTTSGILNPGTFQQVKYTDCFDVTDGDGDFIDFCNPPLTFTSPSTSTDNDFIALTFDKETFDQFIAPEPSPLGSEIYLCATGITTDGQSIAGCKQSAETKLRRLPGPLGEKYEIVIWPRGFFNLSDEQSLEAIEYYLTDETGTIKVGYANSENKFRYTFRCN